MTGMKNKAHIWNPLAIGVGHIAIRVVLKAIKRRSRVRLIIHGKPLVYLMLLHWES